MDCGSRDLAIRKGPYLRARNAESHILMSLEVLAGLRKRITFPSAIARFQQSPCLCSESIPAMNRPLLARPLPSPARIRRIFLSDILVDVLVDGLAIVENRLRIPLVADALRELTPRALNENSQVLFAHLVERAQPLDVVRLLELELPILPSRTLA